MKCQALDAFAFIYARQKCCEEDWHMAYGTCMASKRKQYGDDDNDFYVIWTAKHLANAFIHSPLLPLFAFVSMAGRSFCVCFCSTGQRGLSPFRDYVQSHIMLELTTMTSDECVMCKWMERNDDGHDEISVSPFSASIKLPFGGGHIHMHDLAAVQKFAGVSFHFWKIAITYCAFNKNRTNWKEEQSQTDIQNKTKKKIN